MYNSTSNKPRYELGIIHVFLTPETNSESEDKIEIFGYNRPLFLPNKGEIVEKLASKPNSAQFIKHFLLLFWGGNIDAPCVQKLHSSTIKLKRW